MKRKILVLLIIAGGLILLSLGLVSFCENDPLDEELITSSDFKTQGKTLSIPDNIAYGQPTLGGLGGTVIKVTNLNASGPGSFVQAVKTKGPRIIVFEVAGIIDLKKSRVTIVEPFVTIAGQTAPSPGITFIKGGIDVKAHDVVIQHIRIRPGDAGASKSSGFDPDGLAVLGERGHNVIVDHCSFSWSVDENLSAAATHRGEQYATHDVTFSNNIIAEGLRNATHPEGEHSMGSLVNDFTYNIVFVGNLYASNKWRNPFFKSYTKGAVINNVIYNPGSKAIHMNWSEEELASLSVSPKNGKISVVGNVLRGGPDTASSMALVTGTGDVYLEDNVAKAIDGSALPLFSGNINVLTQKPSWPGSYKAMSAKDVEGYVIKNVGARPYNRDATDKRIIEDFEKLKGSIIDSQADVGGYPVIQQASRVLEVPAQDIEAWLEQYTQAVEFH